MYTSVSYIFCLRTYIVACVTFAINVVIISPLDAQPTIDSKPSEATDSLVASVPTLKDPFNFPKTELGSKLRRHMYTAVAISPESNQKYTSSLEGLRTNPDKAVDLITKSYKQLDKMQFLARWILVETLRELRHHSALSTLISIAQQPIKYPRKSPNYKRDLYGRELSIRVTTIEGIDLLARKGNESARTALWKFARHESLSVRRSAIRGLLASGIRKERILEYVGDDNAYLVHLDVTDPKTVPHPDIEKFEIKKRFDDKPPKMK